MIYLDNSATTRQYDQVTDMMANVMRDTFGNPSSLHRLGLDAEKLIKSARQNVAKALGVSQDEIYFTSGGTEADNTAIIGVARARRRAGKRIITTKVEHPAILKPCEYLEKEGYEVIYLDVDNEGFVDLSQLEKSLTKDTILVSIMAVNNESGAIMPLDKILKIISDFNKENGIEILFHSDMVQSFGKVKIDMSKVDLASVSAHKIHGPKGIGAIYIRKDLNIEPFMLGGGQEKHFRSGTENVPAIAGFGEAARISNENFDERVACMNLAKDTLLHAIQNDIGDIKINTPSHDSAPSVLNISFLKTRGEVLLHFLEQSEIYVSTGSACSSNHKNKGGSHVLRAMGLKDQEIEGAIRFSFSEFNTKEDSLEVARILKETVERFRKLGSFR